MKCFVSPIDEAQDARDFVPGAKREHAEDFSPQTAPLCRLLLLATCPGSSQDLFLLLKS